MNFDHLFWGFKKVPHGCFLQGMKNNPQSFEIDEGLPQVGKFPENASFHMDPEFADNTQPTDQLYNTSGFIVVSERVKELLSARELPNVEWLPVAIYDHRGRALRAPYFVLHAVGVIDLLDVSASGVSTTYDDSISRFTQFVLKADAPQDLPAVLRASGLSSYLLVHRELANAMLAAGFTGCQFLEPKALAGGRLHPLLP